MKLNDSCKYCEVAQLCLPLSVNALPHSAFDEIVSRRIEMKKGSTVFNLGNTFTSFYAVKHGIFKIFIITEDGREQIESFYYPGEFIGFDAVDSGYYRGDLQALTDSCVCEIPYASFIELCNSVPSLQEHLIKLMSQRIGQNHCLRLNTKSIEKIASFLINFTSRMDRFKPNQFNYHFPMSRAEIGDHLGLTAETVIRTFTILRNKQIIECSGKTLTIHNLRALQKLSFVV